MPRQPLGARLAPGLPSSNLLLLPPLMLSPSVSPSPPSTVFYQSSIFFYIILRIVSKFFQNHSHYPFCFCFCQFSTSFFFFFSPLNPLTHSLLPNPLYILHILSVCFSYPASSFLSISTKPFPLLSSPLLFSQDIVYICLGNHRQSLSRPHRCCNNTGD